MLFWIFIFNIVIKLTFVSYGSSYLCFHDDSSIGNGGGYRCIKQQLRARN